MRPPSGGGAGGGLTPLGGSSRALPSLPDAGGLLGPPSQPRGPGGRSGRSFIAPGGPPPADGVARPSSGGRRLSPVEAPSPAPVMTAPEPAPAAKPLVFMRPAVDPKEQASLLSDVTNVGNEAPSRGNPFKSPSFTESNAAPMSSPTPAPMAATPMFQQSVPSSHMASAPSGGARNGGALSSSSFNSGRVHQPGSGSMSGGKGGSVPPRNSLSWNAGTTSATAQQVAAAVANAPIASVLPPAASTKPRDMRKSISGGMKPEKNKMHREKQSKLVVHPLGPPGGGVGGGGVPPPSDCQVIDERTWLTDRIVQYPCCSLSAMLLIPWVMAMVALLKAPFELDIGVDSFEIRSTHFSQQRYLAMNEAIKEENSHYTNRRQMWTPSHQRLGRLEMIYAPDRAVKLAEHPEKVAASTDGDVNDGIEMLRLDRLDYVRRIERAIQDFEGYDKWCRKESDENLQHVCSPPSSVITYLFPSPVPGGESCEFKYDGSGERLVRPISETMEAMAHMPNQDHYNWFFSTTHTEQKSTLMRSQFQFATLKLPTPEEKDEFELWLGDLIDALENQKHENPDTNGVTFLVGGSIPTQILVMRALNSDMMLALSSFFLVLLYTWFHTTSLLLSVMAMLMIALSFPVSLFFYYMFFGDAKLGVLNILSIYIVLGIGVDDCYVFLDAFQQNRHAPDLAQGFGAAFNRSARAMFVTSFTTALAFLANMISSIPVIFSFAVFMATLVIVNYVFTITIFVGIVSVWHHYIEKKEQMFFSELQRRIPCLHKICQMCNSTAEEMTELPQNLRSQPAAPQIAQVEGSHPAPDIDDFATLEDAFIVVDETAPAVGQGQQVQGLKSNATDHEKIVEQLRKHNIHIRSLRKTERWFLFSFGPFLNRNRRNIIGFACLLVAVSAIMAGRLEPSRDIPHLFPAQHAVQLHWSFKNSNFTGGDCDECAANFELEFLCHNVFCGGGNVCVHGKCKTERGQALPANELPYIPAGISNAVRAACNGGTGSTAAMGNAAVSPLIVNADRAQRALEAYMGVWVPTSAMNAMGCDDDYRECYAWAQRGECEDNSAFMSSNCKFSCDLCTHEVENYHQCHDGSDNDGDGQMDCNDPDCQASPRCEGSQELSEAARNYIAQQACLMLDCRVFLEDFLDDCTNADQKGTLRSFMSAGGGCPASFGTRTTAVAVAVSPPCYFTPGNGERDGTAFTKSASIEVERCVCDASEMSFYLATGMMSLCLASFNIYASYQAMNRRNDMFEHRLCMATAAMFYVYGVVPCCFWLACFPGPNESKENGFFGMMLFCGISCAFGLLSLRKKWNKDFMERPDMGSRYLYFAVMATVVLIVLSIIGLAMTSSSASWEMDEDTHILSECKDTSNMNSSRISADTDSADMTMDELDESIQEDAKNEGCTQTSTDIDGTSTQGDCVFDCPDQCGAPERMLYSVGAFVMLTGSLGMTGCMRLEGMKLSPWQTSVTTITLAPFIVYGVLTAVFWVKCVSSNSTQEDTYFIAVLVWTIVVSIGQVLYSAHKKTIGECGFCTLMTILVMILIFASIGVHVTVTNEQQFFQTCALMDDSALTTDGGGAEAGPGQDKISTTGVDGGPAAEWGERECVIDEQCGSSEKTVYGFMTLLMMAGVLQVFCLRGCGIIGFPKSINGVTITLWAMQTLVFMSFWIGCGATDTTVEKPFWVTILISSVILAVALICYAVSLVDGAPKGFDVAMKLQIFVALTFVTIASLLVHVTVTNGDNVLATCQVYERCHWWQAGMTPAIDCEDYWSRLDADCSQDRCGGHGICVGFRLTGGCVCTPSFEGRRCDTPVAVNTNKAEINIIYGLEGTVTESPAIVDIAAGEEAVGNPDYWPAFDMGHPLAQQHIADVCDSLSSLDNILQSQSMMCFMSDFRDWVVAGCGNVGDDECPCDRDAYGVPVDPACKLFPVPKTAFLNQESGGLLKKWLRLDGGKYFMHIGFERHATQGHAIRVSFARISVYTKLSKHAAGFEALSTFNQVENFVARWNDKAENSGASYFGSLAPAYQTSHLWIKMFTEVSAVNGIIYAIVIIAFCSFFTIFVFTGHVRMALIVVTNVFAMLCTILGYFKVAGWSLGIVEAVSALVLLGSSVDYSLHVAEAFVDCSQHNRVSANPMGRSALVTQALTKIGVSVLHAAGTTFLSVICLLFCTVTLFVKFGQIILVSVLISIAFALMPLPASLGLMGPKRFRRSFKRQVFMLLTLTVFGLMGLTVVYSMDASGQIDLVGPAGEPLFGRKIRVENGAFGET